MNSKVASSIFLKEDDIYIEVPIDIVGDLKNQNTIVKDYIRIYKNINKLKDDISRYLFDDKSTVSASSIGYQFMKIKSEENLDKILPFMNIDINKMGARIERIAPYFGIDIEDINSKKEDLKNEYVNNSYNTHDIVDRDYLEEIINDITAFSMYSLKTKSRYGGISTDISIKNKDEISDYNNEGIGGNYCPILVIYRPAKYNRGQYVLEDTYYVYIKRQPLDALIKQERLDEKGVDGMGAISYKKLRPDLTNENLQEILAELYVYSQRNSLAYENIKLADISSNKIWMTADKLKKEFKELRYYHKNVTSKVKEIYDSASRYYTQISGKYIFDSRELVHCYKTYKSKDINN